MPEIMDSLAQLVVGRYRPQIEAALEHADGTHALEDIAAGVAAGRFQLWPGPHSVIITEIISYPRKKSVHFFLAGGNLAELEAMVPEVLEWARTVHGCSMASLAGRRGWERSFLRRDGWRVAHTVMTKGIA